MRAEHGSSFDAAPFGLPLTGEVGLKWEDPREVHRVVVCFRETPPADLGLEYWRTRWPQQRLPKEAVPGGGGVGWWELGNWFTGSWQRADAEVTVEGKTATFAFRPLNEREFADLGDFPATFRTTLKVRLVAASDLPPVEAMEVYTDSAWDDLSATVLFETAPRKKPKFEAFNGRVTAVVAVTAERYVVKLLATRNADPNSWDKTLLTVRGEETMTVLVEDLGAGPVCVPDYGVAVVAGDTEQDYAGVLAECLAGGRTGIHAAVSAMPEQTWARSWANMVPKRSRIYLPLGTDGGRHRFGLNPDGSLFYHTNNAFLAGCPGRDSARIAPDGANLGLSFGLGEPAARTIQEGTLPIGIATWQTGALRIEQTAFATVIGGTDPEGGPPAADALGVFLARFRFANPSEEAVLARLTIRASVENAPVGTTMGDGAAIAAGGKLRAIVETRGRGELRQEGEAVVYDLEVPPQTEHAVVVKAPYLEPEGEEMALLRALDFEPEREAVATYWRRRIAEGMTLRTPEPLLNEFHAAHATHLLVNCELEPGAERRFARVGSFHYACFGNESCMMIVDLDRRGYHREARECLDAFMEYQGTVGLPGDFSSQEGVLYGAHGYEHGGYNQHHGWISWCLIEHYRFTRDEAWLKRAAPHVVAASDWIIRERARTLNQAELGRGLLPFGSLEDIGDWWQWLSTNLYTWRGLDAAAWGLEAIAHQDAARLRTQADEYRASILAVFTEARRRSPVIRLRDGTWVPHFPSQTHRRGRSFGWICETLEGAIHFLISRMIPAEAPDARWIMEDYEDNLYNSGHYGYALPDYGKHWFDWGGFSMQACLLFSPEPYLYRDEVPQALRAIFNGIAANFFADTRMLAEHALPELGDWRGDHYKSSDEANATGWLRHLFVREEGEELLIGQAIPREWLRPGNRIGVDNAATYFGPVGVTYETEAKQITVKLSGPQRNPPARIRLRLRAPMGKRIGSVTVDGKRRKLDERGWVVLPGDVGEVEVRAGLR